MKKICLLLILTFVCIMTCACFKESDTSRIDTSAVSTSESDTIETEITMTEVPIELYSVDIKQESIHTDSYSASMIYPQISGYSDAEIEEKVNALIYSYANSKRNTAISQTGADSGVNYDVYSFDVTYKSDKLISALCRGSVTVEGSSSVTEFAYGINIDFVGVKLIGFDGIVDYKKFEKDFTDGAYIQTNGYENLLSETTFADIISQYSALYSIYPDFYIKQSDAGVKLGVIADTVQVLGGLAEFEGVVSNKGYTTKYFADLIS